MKGVLSGGRMVWVDKVLGGNQIRGIMCVTLAKQLRKWMFVYANVSQKAQKAFSRD